MVLGLVDLCLDELSQVIQFLDSPSILSLMSVCRRIYGIFEPSGVTKRDIWKDLFLAHFPEYFVFLEHFDSSKQAFRRSVQMRKKDIDHKIMLKLMKISFSKGTFSYRLLTFDLLHLLPTMKKDKSFLRFSSSFNMEASKFLEFVVGLIKKGCKDDPIISLLLEKWEEVYIGFRVDFDSERFKLLEKKSKDRNTHLHIGRGHNGIYCQDILYITMFHIMKSTYYCDCQKDLKNAFEDLDKIYKAFFQNNYSFFDHIDLMRGHFCVSYAYVLNQVDWNKNKVFCEESYRGCFDPDGNHIDDDPEYDMRRYKFMSTLREYSQMYDV